MMELAVTISPSGDPPTPVAAGPGGKGEETALGCLGAHDAPIDAPPLPEDEEDTYDHLWGVCIENAGLWSEFDGALHEVNTSPLKRSAAMLATLNRVRDELESVECDVPLDHPVTLSAFDVVLLVRHAMKGIG